MVCNLNLLALAGKKKKNYKILKKNIAWQKF